MKLKGYSIKSQCGTENGHHFKSWKVLGSNDNSNWFEFDSKIFRNILNVKIKIKNFINI